MALTSCSVKQPICTNAHCSELLEKNRDQSIFAQKTHITEGGELSRRSGSKHLDEEEDHVPYDENHRSSCESSGPGPRPNSRWVKRLRLQSMNSFALGTKSYEIDDHLASGSARKVFSRMPQNHDKSNRGIPLHKCLEQHHSDESILFAETEGSHVEVLKKSAWIRRWCHECRERVSSEDRQKRVGLRLHEMGEHLPSVTAMALMGKVVGKYRRCEIERRGTCIVWKGQSISPTPFGRRLGGP